MWTHLHCEKRLYWTFAIITPLHNFNKLAQTNLDSYTAGGTFSALEEECCSQVCLFRFQINPHALVFLDFNLKITRKGMQQI